jgi:hypothetical protein
MRKRNLVGACGALLGTLTLLASCPATALLTDVQKQVKEASSGGQTVSTPIFSPASVTSSTDLDVTIQEPSSGATVYYTSATGGAVPPNPTASSTAYVAGSKIAVKGDGTIMTIKAIAKKSGMADSSVATATYTISYYAPGLPGATVGSGQVTVTWGVVSGATSYNLYWAAGSTVTKAGGTKVTSATTTSTVTGLTNGTQYAFGVTAMSSEGESALSPIVTATPLPQWTTVGGAGFTVTGAQGISLAMGPGSGKSKFGNPGTPYVAFQDGQYSNKASVMMYGTSWTGVGAYGFSSGAAAYLSLVFTSGSSPIPYVAYQDGGNSSKAAVMKLDGTIWSPVPASGASPSAGQANYVSLAFDSSNTPYVAFQDVVNGNKATVMKFDGSNWVAAGNADFSAGAASYVSLKIAGTTPYVAYVDAANGYKATVMTLIGSTWTPLGSAGFATSDVSTALLLDSGGVPYVLCVTAFASPSGGGYRETVMKYNGSSWIAATSTASQNKKASFAIDANGTPYLGYQDVIASGPGTVPNKLTVIKYDGSNWVVVGSSNFSLGQVDYVSIAIDSGPSPAVPNVAYEDLAKGNKASLMQFK